MSHGNVKITVECTDALTRPLDVLVLKYAQQLYGVDRAAATAIGLDRGRLPREGDHLLVDGRPGTTAASLLFLGVRPIDRFDYGEIRRFGKRALAVAAETVPGAREIGLTLHGAGFGLDEVGAFESEVAGVLDSVMAQQFPSGLEKVVFLEADQRRANAMEVALDRLVPRSGLHLGEPASSRAQDQLRSAGDDSGAKGHAFVAMPFAEAFEDVFYFGIAPTIRKADLLCERADKSAFTGDIVHHMRDRISSARFVVADLSGGNPNVYLEVGFAWGRDVPTILLCNQTSELEFDVKGHRCLMYTSIRDLERKLTEEITRLRT
jgi:hypothetical protein